MKMRTLVSSGLAGIVLAGLSVPAVAQFQKPEDAVKYRKATFTVMAAHFGRIGAMAQGRAPFDAKAAASNADVVATLAGLPWGGFGDGTQVGDHRAKPNVWTEADKFRASGQDLIDASIKLQAAARSGDLAQVKAAFGDTAKTCKACHDHFRKD